MTSGDSFDDVRLTAADCMTEFGAALQHARQAFEQSEIGASANASEAWGDAARIFHELCDKVSELEYICQQARIHAQIEEAKNV